MNKTIAAVATFAALGAGALSVHAFDLKGVGHAEEADRSSRRSLSGRGGCHQLRRRRIWRG